MRMSNEMDTLSRISDFLVNNANFFPDAFFLSFDEYLINSRESYLLDDNEQNRHDLIMGKKKAIRMFMDN